MSRGKRRGGERQKDHIDYAYDLDIMLRSTSIVPTLGKPYGYYTGSGNVLFSTGWGIVRSVLGDILTRFHASRGYKIVETPILARTTLYEVSGHLSYYRENMYIFNVKSDEESGGTEEFALKPMNCPYHILVLIGLLEKYRGKVRFPFKIFELGKVHRYELSGTLRGLLRLRGFTQDDAHIFTPKSEAVKSIVAVFDELKILYEKLFNISVDSNTIKLRLSFSEPSAIGTEFMGTKDEWLEAEETITRAAEEIRGKYGVEYYVGRGEAAFYGPKIDVVATIEEGGETKEWQIGTMQFDFNLPKRFGLPGLLSEVYGEDVELYMIHRALLGSLERFMGVYLELVRGRLPFVLAPLQVALIPILTGVDDVDNEIVRRINLISRRLDAEGMRYAIIEATRTNIGGTIRRLETSLKPPIYVMIGGEEVEEDTVALRVYDYASRSSRRFKERFDETGEPVMSIVERLEEPVVDLAGYRPRLPVSLDYVS